MADLQFAFGDRIEHSACPEWGVGTVTRVQNLVHEGSPCQRLSARFERAGLKTVLTALADIRPAGESPAAPNGTPDAENAGNGSDDPSTETGTGHLDGKELKEIFGVMPEPARDPFASLADKLKATLGLYRFTQDGGSLLDWASVQTKLSDPLSRYSRAEMEQEFARFAYERDTHLRSLIREARRTNDEAALALLRQPPAPAAKAVTRFNGAR